MAVKDWSTTAADNDDADATINWLEGQSPATVNNSARAMMAALASWRDLIDYGTVSGGTVGGSANAITLTNSPTVGAREAGRRYLFKYTNTGTTGAVTLVVDGLTSGAIQYLGAALVPGDIATDDWVLVGDDGTNFQLLTTPRVSYLKLINGLTADATPDGAADYLVTYDASASLPKKVLPNALVATQAQMETGASNDVYVSPGRQKSHPLHPKAWANFDGTTTGTNAPSAGSGVTSITRNSTGDYTCNLGITMSATTYAYFGLAKGSTVPLIISSNAADSKSTTAFQFKCRRETGAAVDAAEISIFIFGDI